jgi:DNA-binding FadR family transcriptional regulator
MEKIRQKTIVQQVMDHLKQLIARGVYTAGDRIPTEQELSQQLGVGRSSIREAIKIFNHLGVMESKSALGTFVCERSNISKEALTWALLLGNDELEEVVELRGAIELWSFTRLTMLHSSHPEEAKPHIELLEQELERMKACIENGDRERLIEADYDFHSHVIRSSNNPLFMELYGILRSFMFHEIEKTQGRYVASEGILEEHRNLLDAIESGDVSKAEDSYLNHINNIKNLAKS